MALTKTDLRDATLLLKAGKIEATRHILSSSNDPRAAALLDKFNARFPPPSHEVAEPHDDLSEIKNLIRQKNFAEAEKLLRVSHHPKANYLLQKIAQKKAEMRHKRAETARPHSRRELILRSFSTVLSRFQRKRI